MLITAESGAYIATSANGRQQQPEILVIEQRQSAQHSVVVSPRGYLLSD